MCSNYICDAKAGDMLTMTGAGGERDTRGGEDRQAAGGGEGEQGGERGQERAPMVGASRN